MSERREVCSFDKSSRVQKPPDTRTSCGFLNLKINFGLNWYTSFSEEEGTASKFEFPNKYLHSGGKVGMIREDWLDGEEEAGHV